MPPKGRAKRQRTASTDSQESQAQAEDIAEKEMNAPTAAKGKAKAAAAKPTGRGKGKAKAAAEEESVEPAEPESVHEPAAAEAPVPVAPMPEPVAAAQAAPPPAPAPAPAVMTAAESKSSSSSSSSSGGKVAMEQSDDDDDDEPTATAPAGSSSSSSSSSAAPAAAAATRRKCPFLDTIDRSVLDFDLEKQCSVTLSRNNVYACLVCGKFFAGRGKATPAYTHSVQCGHFVFMHLTTGAFHCLPDNYEVVDSSLLDISRALHPTYSSTAIAALNKDTSLARDVHGVAYLPGFVGLNNMRCTDFVNVVLHALAHVTPLRDFFLVPENYSSSRSAMVQRFGEVLRRLWSAGNFKSTVSPQELLHEVTVASGRRFVIGRQSEAAHFLVWFLDELHRGLVGSGDGTVTAKQRAARSIVHDSFQGSIQVTSLVRRPAPGAGDGSSSTGKRPRGGDSDGDSDSDGEAASASPFVEQTSTSPFVLLSLPIPQVPLFKDGDGGLVIPQVPLLDVLKKFDGVTWTDAPNTPANIAAGGPPTVRRRYSIKRLPQYLIIHLTRFTRNNFYREKNATIVTFPLRNLEMKDYCAPQSLSGARAGGQPAVPSDAQLAAMSVGELKAFVRGSGGRSAQQAMGNIVEKAELQELAAAVAESQRLASGTKYDLIANICHDSPMGQGLAVEETHNANRKKAPAPVSGAAASAAAASEGSGSAAPTSTASAQMGNSAFDVLEQGKFRCHLLNKATGQWFEVQDLYVTETPPQTVGLSESYMLVYERKSAPV